MNEKHVLTDLVVVVALNKNAFRNLLPSFAVVFQHLLSSQLARRQMGPCLPLKFLRLDVRQ